jgi:hypothetical protein
MAETTVNWLLCCGFRRTGKAMGQVYQCWWSICREINVFFPGSNITYFTFYINFWPIYWLSLVRTHMWSFLHCDERLIACVVSQFENNFHLGWPRPSLRRNGRLKTGWTTRRGGKRRKTVNIISVSFVSLAVFLYLLIKPRFLVLECGCSVFTVST